MSEDERAIRALVDRWMEASRAGDTAAVLELMSDDVLFTVPGREPFGKDEFRATSEAMKEFRVDGRAEVREIEVGGEPMRRSVYTLTILKKGGDGRWRLFRDANLVA